MAIIKGRERRRDDRRARRERRRARKKNPLGTSPMQPELTENRTQFDQLGQQSTGQYLQDRSQLQGMADQYGALAAGEGPSLAQDQLKAATDANIAATIAAQGSARGGNLNATQANAAAAGAGMQQQAAQQAAMLRSQEQLQAMNAQAGLAGQLAGMSVGREQAMLGAGQQGLQFQQGQAQDFQMQNAMLREQRRKERGDRWTEGIGMGLETAGTIVGAAASDVRAKKRIKKLGKGGLAEALAAFEPEEEEQPSLVVILSKASETMGDLEPYEYDYNEKGRRSGGKPGRKAGVMAQDLAKTELGKGLVHPDEHGTLTIDGGGALTMLLAAGADHERRLRELENGRVD